jgi:hypothetical protein
MQSMHGGGSIGGAAIAVRHCSWCAVIVVSCNRRRSRRRGDGNETIVEHLRRSPGAVVRRDADADASRLGMRQQRPGHVPPVVGVGHVPLHGLPEAILPARPLAPAEPLELLVVEEVPLVVEGPVVDELDGLLRAQAEEAADVPGHVHHRALLLGADVVDVAHLAAVEDDLERLGHVVAVEVAADVGAVAVDGQALAPHGQQHELGDELLRELVGPVHVVPARGDDGEAVAPAVRHHQHLGPGLGGRVRVGGQQLRRLVVAHHGVAVSLAVHLVGADVDEAADLGGGAAGLEEDVGAVDVVLGELQGVAEGVVHVGLRREVHHGVDALGGQDEADEVGAGDVALDELEVVAAGAHDGEEVLEVGAVVKLVQHHHLVLRVPVHDADRHVGRDEPRGARDQDPLGLVRCCRRH